jgi:hypothetical protein
VKTILLLIFILSPNVFAGGGVTGEDGGHGVLCRTQSRHLGIEYLYTLEVLDLFEARRMKANAQPRVTPNLAGELFRSNNVCRILMLKKRKFKASRLSHAFDEACDLSHKIEIVDDAIVTRDAGQLMSPIPNNCQIVQLANRVMSLQGERFYIDREYASYLNEVDVAALLLHETLHKYSKASTTQPIRKIVGLVFTQ